MRFTCPVDGALNDVPELVNIFRFPEDLRETMDLLEGRLNCVVCPACKQATAMLTLVMVLDKDGKTALLVGPQGVSWESKQLAEVEAAGFQFENVRDYDALRLKVIERLDRYLKPTGPVILPSKAAPLSRSECIKRMSPLVLRLFKSRIDGFLPPLFQFSGSASPEVLTQLEREMYVSIVCDHLQRILQEAARESKALSLFDQVKEFVPKECLTNEVLQAQTEKCRSYVAPDKNPREFSGSYMQELLSAVVHACAGKTNPRGKEMAGYLITAWIFGRRADVQMDPQFLLSADLVQRILRFEDLWDVWMAGERKLTEEYLNAVSEMLEHYGFADRVLETLQGKFMWIGQQQDGKLTDPSKFAAVFEELLLEKMPFNQSHEKSAEGGLMLGESMRKLLQNGQQETALRIADALVAKAKAAGDEIAVVSMTAHATDVLNEFQIFDEATRMIGGAVAGEHEHATWGPALFVYVYSVLGNTMRYTFLYKEALAAYDLALRCVDTLPDVHQQEHGRAVLGRNIGIVYRDTGRYGKALQLLQNAEKRDPQDHKIQFSLAIFYQLINQYPEALRYLNRAIEKAHGPINAPVRGTYLLGRGLLKRSLGDSDGGVEDLRESYDLLPTDKMKLRAAAATLRFQPSTEQGRKFVKRCQTSVADYVEKSGAKDIGLEAVACSELAGAMLQEGNADGAKALLGRLLEDTQMRGWNPPWQLELTMGRACYAKGENARAWGHLSRAWQALEKRVPAAEEAVFSVSWMQDKDEVQSALTRIGCDLVQRGMISPEVLPALYDFSNGREISSRILGERALHPSAPEALLANYRAALSSSAKRVDTFFFLEGESTVFVGHISAAHAVEIIGDLGIGPGPLNEMRNAFRGALRMANPADLGDIERQIDGWEQVETRISALVLSRTTSGAQILFLPGRALTGLPLHLIRSSAGTRLVEEHVVCYSPNFTTASASHSVAGKSTRGFAAVVCVTAQKDGPGFQQTALDAGARLVKLLKRRGTVDYLKQGAADHRAVRKAMKRVKEIVFLCHGTTAGFEGGYGICLADEGDLPPRVLSVEEFPEHANFILSWRDLEEAPNVVASIACSSGLTEIGGGGVRFGLEQSLFSAGTHTIISPLWDVEQRSALSWMEQFYANRFAHPDWTIDRAYQQTCLDMRDQYKHFFFWGPFAMNVSAIGGKEAA